MYTWRPLDWPGSPGWYIHKNNSWYKLALQCKYVSRVIKFSPNKYPFFMVSIHKNNNITEIRWFFVALYNISVTNSKEINKLGCIIYTRYICVSYEWYFTFLMKVGFQKCLKSKVTLTTPYRRQPVQRGYVTLF